MLRPRPSSIACAVLLALPLLGLAPAAQADLPGRYVVRGAPLVGKGKAAAGRSLSVFGRPAAVTVDGCRSRRARVRSRRGTATISVTLRCKGTKGAHRLRGRIAGSRLRGTIQRGRKRARRFRAALKAPPGVRLRGRRSARALAAVRDVDRLQRHPDFEISAVRGSDDVARTEIVLRLTSRAKVGQVNAALEAAGGRIAGSVAGSPRLVVAIPDPGSVKALDSVLAGLRRLRGVASADRSFMAATQELPPAFGSPPSAGQASELSHLLAMRMPAAWNARRAIRLDERPTLIVADKFGDGPLSTQVDAAYDQSALFTGQPTQHGYHVTGIAAAAFANDGSPAGRVTGVFPATARLVVVDVVGQTLDGAAVQVLQAVRANAGRVVVQTSLGHDDPTTDRYAREEGSDWTHEVRSAGLVFRMLHAASAGNDGVLATNNSPWASAATRTDLVDADGFPAPRLQQTLAVENVVDTGAPAFDSGCLSGTSNHGGTVAAVGHEVFSHKLGSAAGNLNGTSMASPQVAGLAEYLWSIAPDLTAPQVRDLIVATAAPPLGASAFCGDVETSQPRLDAYTAVLSLDQAATVTPASAPVRLAILDVTGDGAFTDADLQTLAPAATGPAVRDWSRNDMNGDGVTGGGGEAPFDLDPSGGTRAGAPVLGNATTAIETLTVTFDEHAVTDVEMLCFYAHSGLYTGDPAQRNALLDPETVCQAPVRSGSITLGIRRLTVNSSAGCGSGGDFDQDASGFGDVGPFSDSISVSSSCSDTSDGLTSSSDGSASHSGSVSVNATTGVVTIQATGSGSGSCSVTATEPGATGGNCGADGGGNFQAGFTVDEGTVRYTITGNGTIGSCLRFAGNGSAIVDQCDTSVGFSANQSGSLEPGSYSLVESCSSGSAGVDNGPGSASKSCNDSVTLTLDP